MAGLSPLNTASLAVETEWQMGFVDGSALAAPIRQVPRSVLAASGKDEMYRDLIKDALWEAADHGGAVIAPMAPASR